MVSKLTAHIKNWLLVSKLTRQSVFEPMKSVFYFCSFVLALNMALNIEIDVHPENRAVEREQVFPLLDYMKTQVDGLFSF